MLGNLRMSQWCSKDVQNGYYSQRYRESRGGQSSVEMKGISLALERRKGSIQGKGFRKGQARI